ncbi:putative ribonuclease H-like domain-containing protein [Tanacetum coccineum]
MQTRKHIQIQQLTSQYNLVSLNSNSRAFHLEIAILLISSDDEHILENDRFLKNRYKAVPPPVTGNFLTLRADISFAGLDEYAIRNKIIESQTTELNNKTSETAGKTNDANTEKPKSVSESVVSNPKINRDSVIIEDWTSDDEEEVSGVQKVRPENQTNTDHLIKDYNFHDKKSQESNLKNVVNTGKREGKPVWDNTKRVNHQNFSKYPHLSKTFVPSGVLTRTEFVSTVRPSVSTARPVCTDQDGFGGLREIPGSCSKDSGSFMLKKVEYVDPKGVFHVCTWLVSLRVLILIPFCAGNPEDLVYRIKAVVDMISTNDLKASTRKGLEKQLNHNVKIIRCDNGTEFKNYAMNEFCAKKGIKREFSVARTPQQNGVAERKNRILIEAARTMLADSLLPIPFWAEAVSTACYVLNRVLVTKPQNKTPYELLIGKSPSIILIDLLVPLTILNTLYSLGKLDGKSDEGYLLGYSTSSKAFRVYHKRTKRVEENLHTNFLEDQPNVAGTGPNWMFDLDFLTNSMNYIPVSIENQVNMDAGIQDSYIAGSSGKDKGPTQEYILLPLQPYRTRIPVEDVALAAHEKPSKSSPKDNDVQD